MKKLFQRWFDGGRPAAWDLSGYPAFELPHPGFGQALTEAQAHANWAYFSATLDERQRRLRDWLLAHDGPDIDALPGVDYAKALNAWAKAHWPQLPAFAGLPAHKPWPDGPRNGPFIVYSLLGDLGASLGEAIRRANPRWRWGLNMDAIDLADNMHTSRRVVLLAALQQPTPETAEADIDVEGMVMHDYRFPDSPNFVHLDTWGRTAADAISGRYYSF